MSSEECSQQVLYEAVYNYKSKVNVPFMRRLYELIYFLLENGVVPTERTIHVACVNGETRLLEDLLKYYDGPLEKEFNTPDLPPSIRLSTVVEVLCGFEIKVSIRLHSGEVLSPLEYFILEYVMYRSTTSEIRQFIKDVTRVYPPPNMEMIFAICEALDFSRERAMKAYDIYEQVKNDLIQIV